MKYLICFVLLAYMGVSVSTVIKFWRKGVRGISFLYSLYLPFYITGLAVGRVFRALFCRRKKPLGRRVAQAYQDAVVMGKYMTVIIDLFSFRLIREAEDRKEGKKSE